jgi:hypothetical protein
MSFHVATLAAAGADKKENPAQVSCKPEKWNELVEDAQPSGLIYTSKLH